MMMIVECFNSHNHSFFPTVCCMMWKNISCVERRTTVHDPRRQARAFSSIVRWEQKPNLVCQAFFWNDFWRSDGQKKPRGGASYGGSFDHFGGLCNVPKQFGALCTGKFWHFFPIDIFVPGSLGFVLDQCDGSKYDFIKTYFCLKIAFCAWNTVHTMKPKCSQWFWADMTRHD